MEALEGVTLEDAEHLLHTAFEEDFFCISVIRPKERKENEDE